jgi:hypothetical protein
VITAYLSNNGYFFPKRFPAAFQFQGEASEGGRRFDVIEITPARGRAMDFWFDRDTHLIRYVVDKQGTPAVKMEAGDYRRVRGVSIAFRLTALAPDGQVMDRGVVDLVDCRGVHLSLFDPPKS